MFRKIIFALTFILFSVTNVYAQSVVYEEVTYGVAIDILQEEKSGYTYLVDPASGDTLTTWVTHASSNGSMAGKPPGPVDLIISCYPNKIPFRFQSKHVLQGYKGKVFIKHLDGKRIRIRTEK